MLLDNFQPNKNDQNYQDRFSAIMEGGIDHFLLSVYCMPGRMPNTLLSGPFDLSIIIIIIKYYY